MSEDNDSKKLKKTNQKDWDLELNMDEAIIAQEKRIEKEIADKTALISNKISLEILLNEYQGTDDVYRMKILDLMKDFKLMRRIRPDGNCFFRAFAFSFFEKLIINNNGFICDYISSAKNFLKYFQKHGFNKIIVEDFYNTYVDMLERIKNKQIKTTDELLEILNDANISNYIVVYMRLVTSAYLQRDCLFYENFIEEYKSVKEFCSHEVEPMYKESDHIHIIAITKAIPNCVSICYLNRSKGNKVTFHQFPEDKKADIFLLYRPGHYDILYKE